MKYFITFLVIYFSQTTFSQPVIRKCVSAVHAEKFGHLIVQTYDGRFEPVHTFASNVIHKISKKDRFDLSGKGEMDAMQIFLDMIIDYEYWLNQRIIYIQNVTIAEKIGINDRYVSMNEIYPDSAHYKIRKFAEEAILKKPADRNEFDREILKIDERVNLMMKVLDGSLLKIFPAEAHAENKWLHWNDSLSFKPINAKFNIINQNLQLKDFCFSMIFRVYLTRLISSVETDDYTETDQVLNYIHILQRQTDISVQIPTESKIEAEILYNKLQLFSLLKYLYGILILFLFGLLLAEGTNYISDGKRNHFARFCFIILSLLFLTHTFGLGFRWYLTGHAPWSNSYEVLIFISWASVISGLFLLKFSRYILTAACFFAFTMLMTAEYSNFDPQLTNLVPQLKSYWLIFHVAIIIIGYGFLGISFLLGISYLCINLGINEKNINHTNLIADELTYTNELSIILGLLFTTIGTFLGAIWANESWGRYWGWDAKETWSLIIIIFYAFVIHLRMIPGLKSHFLFNVLSVFGFGTVIMTFAGVNYYFSKGLHTYATGSVPVFPLWAWITLFAIVLLIIVSFLKTKSKY